MEKMIGLVKNFQSIHFSYELGIILTGIIVLFLTLYFVPIVCSNTIISLKLGTYSSVFFQSNFYKLPLRWIGILCILFISLFKKNERFYVKRALITNDKPLYEDMDFLSRVSKEPIYSYSLFILHTTYFLQQIRSTKKMCSYKGFLGFLQLQTDVYEVSCSSQLFTTFQSIRFSFGQWIPKESEEQLINSWKEREEQLSFELSNNSLNDVEIQTRTITTHTQRRF